MTGPWTQWLKPPRTLLLFLFLLTLVSVSALGWFGWRLLEQERLVETQRLQERLEQAVDRSSATVRSILAETGERLGNWDGAEPSSLPVKDGVVLVLKENSITASPAGRLLYYPFPSSEMEAGTSAFAEGEMFEFVQGQPAAALQSYERLAGKGSAAMRAGALLRMARVLRTAHRTEESLAAYRRLAAIPGVRVAGVAAELVARHELCILSRDIVCADSLRKDLTQGRWHLTRGQFAFYWSETARMTGSQTQPPAEAAALSDLASSVWEARARNSEARGQETLWISGLPFFLMWRGTAERRVVLVARPESYLQPGFAGEGFGYAVMDAQGRVVAGRRSSAGRSAVRTAGENQLPWTIYISAAQPIGPMNFIFQQRFLLLGISVMVIFLILGTYFIGRAIHREAEVLRMQSDFVSAVSHEFRSPLTAMRQLSEILALGRVPSEERRQLYYQTLVKETTRLQRVVEALLNFGRMEAGARRYHFEELDASQLVRRVVSEFEQQMLGSGRHIELTGAETQCVIDADPDAISVALRNLLDNAVKYSPEQPTVWVEWDVADEHVAIKVRDQGLGVAESERKAIFQKFVRGSAASASNVKGSGVGLAMVRHIVAAHGGEITLASKSGQGSTFTILLPVVVRS